jgi:hypothetical protein
MKTDHINARRPKAAFLAPLALAAISLALWSGCGVVTDFVRDNQIHVGSLGLRGFDSPAKLRVGILPFRDEVGLGTPEAGPNLAILMTEKFQENSNLIMIPPAEVARAFSATGWDPSEELTGEQAIELGRILKANVIMEGAISQVDQRRLRMGWRRIARFFTSQRTYLDAVLSLRAFDTENGLVITSRAGEGTYTVGKYETDPFAPNPATPPPTQESIETGLDLAIEDAYYRSLDGLSYTPFKARVIDRSGSTVTINYGSDVGLKRGLEFVSLSTQETITSRIDYQYAIPGPAQCRLVVAEVGPETATLEIKDGEVSEGEFIQSWED